MTDLLTNRLESTTSWSFPDRDVTPSESRLSEYIAPRVSLSTGGGEIFKGVTIFPQSILISGAQEPFWRIGGSGFVVRRFDLTGFKVTLDQIVELTRGDESDEYGVLRPTEYAFRQTIDLLAQALGAMHQDTIWQDESTIFPRGAVTTDENGGLRIEWLKDDRAVHLVVPSVREGRSYVYHEFGSEYGTEERVTGRVLAKWLQRFVK